MAFTDGGMFFLAANGLYHIDEDLAVYCLNQEPSEDFVSEQEMQWFLSPVGIEAQYLKGE